MASQAASRLFKIPLRVKPCQKHYCSLSHGGTLTVQHDRHNRCFTVTPGSSAAGGGAGASQYAVLYYKFTGDKQVDLMSTFVPETFRGQRIAALLSQAAMDFLLEEGLKAHVSCWYIKKYIEEHPHQQYKDLLIS